MYSHQDKNIKVSILVARNLLLPVLLYWVSASNNVLVAQGLLGDQSIRAEQLMIDFVAERVALPSSWVAVGIGKMSSLVERSVDIADTDVKVVSASVRAGTDNRHYFAFWLLKNNSAIPDHGMWEELLVVGGKRHFHLSTNGTLKGSLTRSEDDTVDAKKSTIRARMPAFDPYFLCAVRPFEYIVGKAHVGWGASFISTMDCESGKVDKDGLVVGRWTAKDASGWTVDLSFDEKKRRRLVRAVWYLTDIKPNGEKSMRVKSTIETDWTRAEFPPATSAVWLLSTVVRRDYLGTPNDVQHGDWRMKIMWSPAKLGDLPVADAEVWMEPLSTLFKTDLRAPAWK